MPFPRKALERAALAGEFVEIAADVFDGRNAGFEQRAVRRIPVREIPDRLAAGRLLVFRQQIFDLRPVAVRAERGRQRMVDARGVDADHFDVLLGQPLGGAFAQARRIAEIFLAVRISAVPAGVDEDDVAALDRRLGALEIGRLDQLPFLFRNRQHDAGAEERLQRQIADRRRAGNEMDRRVDVRRGVKNRGDLVRHHALLGVVRDALELDLLVAREDRRIHAPAMAELVQFKPAHRIDNGRHFGPSPDAAGGSDRPSASHCIAIRIGCVTIQWRFSSTPHRCRKGPGRDRGVAPRPGHTVAAARPRRYLYAPSAPARCHGRHDDFESTHRPPWPVSS